MSVLDLVISGGTVIDGTGASAFRADVGVHDGRIVAIGEVDEPARSRVEATDLIVAPGIIDPHTHYDAQLYWDPHATPSSWHGVTTVVAGNCGFTLAPLKSRDADYTREMMVNVEGMPLDTLQQGPPWDWSSFGEYLDGLTGRVAVNAGFMVGHCALRRYVLGDDFARESAPGELEQISQLLNQSLASGGLGLSTTRSYTHNDADGVAVPSRWASEEEVLTLCGVVGQHDGTSLEAIVSGCMGRFSNEEIELLAQMSATARRPLNWNMLLVDGDQPERAEHQLLASRRARELAGRVVALTMPVFAASTQSFLTYCSLWHLNGWTEVLSLPVAERIRQLRDPAVRQRMVEGARASALSLLADFDRYVIGDVYSEENEAVRGRSVGDIARERGEDAFTTLVDIVIKDDLRTVLWPVLATDRPKDWELRRQLWNEDDVLLGGSDAGAHVDRMLGSPYPTRFLADCLRGRKLLPVERAVQLMTEKPAMLFGLRDRGRLQPGYHADIMIFDPATVGATFPRTSYDLPAKGQRLLSDPEGVERVLVNGREIVVNGEPTDETPGTILRSGRDTRTSVNG
jgi:N-acyl-D-aspartate/D-glutamate deacylase